MKVSVLIPFRQTTPWSYDCLMLVQRWWTEYFPGAEIVIGSSPAPFNRSAARNDAARRASGDVFVVCDADTVPSSQHVVENMVSTTHMDPQRWFLPFRHVQLTESYTQMAILNAQVLPITPSDVLKTQTRVPGGVRVVSSAAYEHVGGFDEGFEGWGYEDTAFRDAMDVIVGPHQCYSEALHLWHPRSPDRDPESSVRNQHRFAMYQRARGNEEMHQLLDYLGVRNA